MKYTSFIVCNIYMAIILSACGQQPEHNLKQFIPNEYKIYMIGETHLDQDSPSAENSAIIQQTTIIEDSIRKYLVERCGVNHFMLEIPNSNGYFVRQYMDTGDESWINSLHNNTYLYARIKSLRQLKIMHPDLRVTCVDGNYPKDANKTIFAIFTLAFYDHYWKAYYPPYSNTTAKPVSSDLNIAISIMKQDTANITPELNAFFTELIKLLLQGDAAADAFYTLLIETNKNVKLLTALQKFYNDGWPEVQFIMKSYMNNFDNKVIDDRMLKEREPELFAFVTDIMQHYPNDVFCMQLGDAHLELNPENNMLRRRILNTYQMNCYGIHLIPQTFAARLQQFHHLKEPYDFGFVGPFSIYALDTANINVLIK